MGGARLDHIFVETPNLGVCTDRDGVAIIGAVIVETQDLASVRIIGWPYPSDVETR